MISNSEFCSDLSVKNGKNKNIFKDIRPPKMYVLYIFYQKTTGFYVDCATSKQRVNQEIEKQDLGNWGSNTGGKQKKFPG